MTTEIILFVLLLFCFLLVIIYYMGYSSERNRNLYLQGKLSPYKRRRSFLTKPEQELLSILQAANVNGNFFVFPQLHLSTLLEVKDEAFDLQGKFDWLNKLYVDYVLFDKDALEPILVIELNDSTHFWGSRKARDQFVEKALEENGIPLYVIEKNELPNRQHIIESVRLKLNGTENTSHK